MNEIHAAVVTRPFSASGVNGRVSGAPAKNACDLRSYTQVVSVQLRMCRPLHLLTMNQTNTGK
jgi:hypothetical protein